MRGIPPHETRYKLDYKNIFPSAQNPQKKSDFSAGCRKYKLSAYCKATDSLHNHRLD